MEPDWCYTCGDYWANCEGNCDESDDYIDGYDECSSETCDLAYTTHSADECYEPEDFTDGFCD